MCTGSKNYFGIGNGFPRRNNAEQFSAGASQVVLVVKNLPACAGDPRYLGSISGLERFPWRRKWQPTPVFLPGKSHGQRSLVGYSSWGCKESDPTEYTHTHTHTHTHAHTPRFSSFASILECNFYLSPILLLVRQYSIISLLAMSPVLQQLMAYYLQEKY